MGPSPALQAWPWVQGHRQERGRGAGKGAAGEAAILAGSAGHAFLPGKPQPSLQSRGLQPFFKATVCVG